MKNYIIMIINAVVLIIFGMFAHSETGGITVALPIIGIILLISAFPVKKQNPVVTHIAVALTLLTAVVFFIIGFIMASAFILIAAIVSLIASILYVMDFLRRKKEREAAKAP